MKSSLFSRLVVSFWDSHCFIRREIHRYTVVVHDVDAGVCVQVKQKTLFMYGRFKW